jgi:threonine dehydratase
MTSPWPISIDDVHAALGRIRPFMPASPARSYPTLDAWIGEGIRLFVKHENFNPTGSFKVRNGLSFMGALDDAARARGVVAATRGNHGLGVAWAAHLQDVACTICVPVGNNPEKNDGMRALGARLIEEGRDYDESLLVAEAVRAVSGATLAHSTNDPTVLAGAATLSLEFLEQEPTLDALVIAVGGGSQAVGAITVTRALRPGVAIYGVQADGLATRSAYDLTFNALREGLTDFITVSDAAIADALRVVLRTTHTLVEGAGAAGLAGAWQLRERLAGQRVGVILSGANIDAETLRRVLDGEL